MYKEMVLEIIRQYGPVESFMAHSFGGWRSCLPLEEIGHDENYRVVLVAPATESKQL
jgi:hypothetical protein